MTAARLGGRRNKNLFEIFVLKLLKIAGDSVLMRKSAVRLEKFPSRRRVDLSGGASSQAGPSSRRGGGENGDFVNIINAAFDVIINIVFDIINI